jgi:hypothetical protein
MIWAEWLQSGDMEKLTEGLNGEVSDVKLRRFACACCRRVWHLLDDERSRHAVEAAERFADGGLTREELRIAMEAARACIGGAPHPMMSAACAACMAAYPPGRHILSREAALCAGDAVSFRPLEVGYEDTRLPYSANGPINPWGRQVTPADEHYLLMVWDRDERVMGEMRERKEVEQRVQAALLCDIFGSPSQSVTVDPVWLQWSNGIVVKLAGAIHAERDFDLLPVLADTLEEAGCDNQDVLSHCRGPGPHVRGCWVVDVFAGAAGGAARMPARGVG